jgi:hypothetical protein
MMRLYLSRENFIKWVVAALVVCWTTVSAFAQTDDPNLAGCFYPEEQKAVAHGLMTLALPYLNNQVLHYRDENGAPTGAYAVRRSLHIYFYDKNQKLMGTAIRRSEAKTSYFDPDGHYVGQCINHKLVTPDNRPVRRVNPGANLPGQN